MDAKKIYKFKLRKNKAGKKACKSSLTLSLTAIPKNINRASPPEDIGKIQFIINPTSKPTAPIISKIAVSIPNLLNPKRKNSLFIFGDVK